MIECTNCGAVGDANFSTNYFDELVCELCGTQSFLQTNTETQDAEDLGLDLNTLSRMRRTKRKSRKKRTRESDKSEGDGADFRAPIQLLDCVLATQCVLHAQAEALVAIGFPREYPELVRELWFEFLTTWRRRGARPLLRCFTEFHYVRRREDRAMDPAVVHDTLEQWEADRARDLERLFQPDDGEEGANAQGDEDARVPMSEPNATSGTLLTTWSQVLDWFVLPDLLGLLALAGRMLNLGVLPCDYARWIARGDLPFHNTLALCPLHLQDAVDSVQMFFDATLRTNWVSTSVVAYRAHYLQRHMALQLPPVNAPLVAHALCTNLSLPHAVLRQFLWISAHFNVAGASRELALHLVHGGGLRKVQHLAEVGASPLESGAGIAACVMVALRLCANWHEWVVERVTATPSAPPFSAQAADRMPRRELAAFTVLADKTLTGQAHGWVPAIFQDHVKALKTQWSEQKQHLFAENYRDHTLLAYPPMYSDGVCVESTEEMEDRIAQLAGINSNGYNEGDGDGDGVKMGDTKTSVGDLDGGEDDDADEARARAREALSYFYPVYLGGHRPCFHAPFEVMLELVSEYVDAPMATVLRWVRVLDLQVAALCRDFMSEMREVPIPEKTEP